MANAWESAPLADDTGTPAWEKAPLAVTPTGERFLQGIKDVSLGAEQLAAHAAGGLGLSDTWAPAVDRRIAELNQQYVPPEGIDWARLGGSTAASAPLMLLPGGMAGSGVMRGLAAGAGTGALTSLLTQPVTDNAGQDYASQKAAQAVFGGITGGALGGLLGGAAKAIAPRVDPNAMELINRNILPTPGQILGGAAKTTEGKAESFPGFGDMIRRAKGQTVEDLNKEIYNSALEPIGARSTQPVGQLGMQEVQKKLGDEFNSLIPNLTFQADQQFANDLRGTIDDARLVLSGRESTTFDNILREKVFPAFSQGGGMTGESMQKVMSELEKQAGKYGSDPSAYVQDLGHAFDEVRSLMMANLVRQNPSAGGHLARINEGWAKFSILRNAAARTGQDEASKQGVVSPGNYFAAVKHADETPYKSRFAVDRGALMQDLAQPAVSVMGSAYPNSGSPGRIFLGTLASGGLGAIHPALALSALAGMGAYTRPGQRMLAAGLTRRPSWAPAARAAVESANPYLSLSAEKLREETMK